MTVLSPPARVEAAAQVMRDFIKGQHAAAHIDDAMKVVREWVEGRRRNDRIFHHGH
jgi:hypothetical protein